MPSPVSIELVADIFSYGGKILHDLLGPGGVDVGVHINVIGSSIVQQIVYTCRDVLLCLDRVHVLLI